METIVIELLLWAGLLIFFWAMRDGLGDVESALDDPDLGTHAHEGEGCQFDQPDTLLDAIGSYLDRPIYRYAVIGGKYYQFIHILTGDAIAAHDERERFLAPGLVYAPCNDAPLVA